MKIGKLAQGISHMFSTVVVLFYFNMFHRRSEELVGPSLKFVVNIALLQITGNRLD